MWGGDGDGGFVGDGGTFVPRLTLAAFCPRGVHSPASAAGLHIQSFPDHKLCRALATADVGDRGLWVTKMLQAVPGIVVLLVERAPYATGRVVLKEAVLGLRARGPWSPSAGLWVAGGWGRAVAARGGGGCQIAWRTHERGFPWFAILSMGVRTCPRCFWLGQPLSCEKTVGEWELSWGCYSYWAQFL